MPRLSFLLPLVLVACGEERERPPPLTGDCEGAACRPASGSGGLVSGGSTTNGGSPSASAGGSENGPDAATGVGLPPDSIFGSVKVLVSADLDTEAFDPGLVVDVAGVDPNGVVRERYRGEEDFVLPSVAPVADGFLSVEYVEGLPELMNTLTVVDLTAGAALELGVFEADVLNQILDAGGLSQVSTLDEERGHAIIRVVDGAGQPLAGVEVTRHDADTAAYDAGETFSDLVPQTQFRGAILLVNLEAAPFPGTEGEVVVTAGGASATLAFPVVENTITLATVTLGP